MNMIHWYLQDEQEEQTTWMNMIHWYLQDEQEEQTTWMNMIHWYLQDGQEEQTTRMNMIHWYLQDEQEDSDHEESTWNISNIETPGVHVPVPATRSPTSTAHSDDWQSTQL